MLACGVSSKWNIFTRGTVYTNALPPVASLSPSERLFREKYPDVPLSARDGR